MLDTCSLLWLASENARLSEAAKARIQESELVFVSAICAWEISLRAKKGELVLPLPPMEWFRRSADQHDLVILALEAEELAASVMLPDHHRDPADRFIIAQAIRHDLAIVTADTMFGKYGVETIV
ncbi:MAG: type II toxin-antitoxin system VapC family toxin [Spirochaetota bacterium]